MNLCENHNYVWHCFNSYGGWSVTEYGFKRGIAEVTRKPDRIHRTEQWMMVPSWDVFERASL